MESIGIELENGVSARRADWEALVRAVGIEFPDPDFEQGPRDRILATIAGGGRAYHLVKDRGGEPRDIVAAKRLDALAEACAIRPTA